MNDIIFNFILHSSDVFRISEQEKNTLYELLSLNKLDWEMIYEIGMKHRIVPAMYYKLKSLGLLNMISSMEVRAKFLQAFKEAEFSNQKYFKEIERLVDVAGDRIVLIKGEILAHDFYPCFATRPFGDCDILCKNSDIPVICTQLNEFGYLQGYGESGEIKIPSKREILFAKMYMKHVIAYVKYDRDFLFVFEPHYNLFWRETTGSPVFSVQMEELIQNKQMFLFGKNKVGVLGDEDFLMYLCIDFYEDANRVSKLAESEDLELIKILDIYAVIHRNIDWETFLHKVQMWKMEKYIFYSLYYVDELYHIVPFEVMAAIKPDDIRYIDEFGFPEELTGTERGRYTHSLRERLFCDEMRKKEMFGQIEKFKKTTFQSLRYQDESVGGEK